MFFNKKLIFLYILAYLSCSHAMEVKNSEGCVSIANQKKPKSLQELCLKPIARLFIHNYCGRDENINSSLDALEALQIPEIQDQQIAEQMLFLSGCTLKLLPDKLLGAQEVTRNEICCAHFHPTKRRLAYTHKNGKSIINALSVYYPAKNVLHRFIADDETIYNKIVFSNHKYLACSYRNDNGFGIKILKCGKAFVGLVIQTTCLFNLVCNFEVKDIYFDTQSKYLMAVLENAEKKIWNLACRRELDKDALSEVLPLFSVDVREKIYDYEVRKHVDQFMHNSLRPPHHVLAFQLQLSNKINVFHRGSLIRLKIRNLRLDTLLHNCSIGTAVKLIHLSQCKKNERSCKKIESPQNIRELLLHKSAISKCDSCENKAAMLIEWRLFNKKQQNLKHLLETS
jgi:hypothetical protein